MPTKFLRALHSSNRLAASGTSSIGIERMFHTEEHRAKMDVFLEKVKQLDPRFIHASPTCRSSCSSARCYGVRSGTAHGPMR